MKPDILENVSLPWRDCWLRATLKTDILEKLMYAGDYCMFLLNLAGDYAEAAWDYLCWRQIICVEIICVEIICVVFSPRWSPMKLHLKFVIEPWATFYLPALKTAKGRWRLLLNNHSRTLISALYEYFAGAVAGLLSVVKVCHISFYCVFQWRPSLRLRWR